MRYLLAFFVPLAVAPLGGGTQEDNQVEVDFEDASSSELYELYKEDLRGPPPADLSLAAIIAKRDITGLELLIGDLEEGNRDIVFGYLPLITEYLENGNLEICSLSEMRARISTAVEKFETSSLWVNSQTRSRRNSFEEICNMYLNYYGSD